MKYLFNPLETPTGSVVSLPVAKLMQETNFKQEAYFWYMEDEESETMLLPYELLETARELHKNAKIYAAFSTEQLIKMVGSVMIGFQYDNNDRVYYIAHYRDPISGLMPFTGSTIPDALANLLYNLIKQNKKPLEEANRWISN